jgi:hypothetical protein
VAWTLDGRGAPESHCLRVWVNRDWGFGGLRRGVGVCVLRSAKEWGFGAVASASCEEENW